MPDCAMGAAPDIEAGLVLRGWKKRSLGGFMDCAGPLWTNKEEGGWACGMLAAGRHLDPARRGHGGLRETLMDHALSSIAWEASGRQKCVSLQMDTHFLASAGAGMFIEARGRVVHNTPGTFFMHGMLTVDSRPVMSAQALMKVLTR